MTFMYRALTAYLLTCSALAFAQGAPPEAGAGEIALAPSRLQLPMKPGESRTEVVHLIASKEISKPVRMLASLGDWTLDRKGEIVFSRPGTNKRSASDWMIYSPVEFVAEGGQAYPIRVTVDVPPETPPGDYTAVLFVEERPSDIKTQPGRKQIRFHFRLAAIFYVMVGELTHKGSLTALEVDASVSPPVITATLKNEGNSLIRPTHSLEVVNSSGERVAQLPESAPGPVLAGAEFAPQLELPSPLSPGSYTVRYRVDFLDGSKVIEGRKAFEVAAAPDAGAPPPPKRPRR